MPDLDTVTDTIRYEIACVCGATVRLGDAAFYHPDPPCHTFRLLAPDVYARALRIWWTLQAHEGIAGVCERVGASEALVEPGWGCCKCRIYNGIARDVCKNCGHVCCGLTLSEAPS